MPEKLEEGILKIGTIGDLNAGHLHLLRYQKFIMVVYICASLLQMAVESHDLSQAEKKLLALNSCPFLKLLSL